MVDTRPVLSPPEDKPSITLEFSGRGTMDVEESIFEEFAKSLSDQGVDPLQGRVQYLAEYFDHWKFISAVASTIPLAVLIKATKDILIKWMDTTRRSITINLGDRSQIKVRDAAELNNVLTILDRSDFAKSLSAAPSSRKSLSKSLTGTNRALADTGDALGRSNRTKSS